MQFAAGVSYFFLSLLFPIFQPKLAIHDGKASAAFFFMVVHPFFYQLRGRKASITAHIFPEIRARLFLYKKYVMLWEKGPVHYVYD